MAETEGYKEDVLSIPTPSAAERSENKFDGLSNPDDGTIAHINFTLDENDFPHETGHDSLPDDAVPFT